MATPLPTSPDLVRGLQERVARALPAEHVEHVGGWWLRHAPGCAWWVGSVLPHGDVEPDELERRVRAVERFHARHGTVPRFQITPQACPSGLDAFLTARGYRRESPMSLRTASTALVLRRASAGSLRVRRDDQPTPQWFEVSHAVHGESVDARSDRDMLGRVERPCAYLSVTSGNDVVAVARVVADDGWAGVFGMATLPRARGQGAGRAALAAVAEWAGAHDADRLYLQVERENVPACRLYDEAGFAEACGYHYRTAG